MLTASPSRTRGRRPLPTSPRLPSRAATVEGLEGRVLLTFNAYIAGPPTTVPIGGDTTYIVSTTGQAAKQWVIHWGDGTSDTVLTAPDPAVGFTSPQTVVHHDGFFGNHPVTATATSTSNATANAVLALNENWTGENQSGATGKTTDFQGADHASVGTNISAAVDTDGTSYVLGIDGKRMSITRFTPTGLLDTSWASSGTYVLPQFTTSTAQDTPRAMAMDTTRNLLYVAGGSNNQWAVARVNVDSLSTVPIAWQRSILTGTATGVWLDSTDGNSKVAFCGTSSASQIQVTVLFAIDTFEGGTWHSAGTTDTGFASPNGYATVPASVYGIPGSPISVTASASAIIEGDDVGLGDDEEFFVSGTVTYCCAANGATGSNMVLIDVLSDGTTETGWGNGNGAATINSCNCTVGNVYDSNYAMVASTIGGTGYLTLVGTTGGSVLTERYTAVDGLRDRNAYGSGTPGAKPGFVIGPTGAAYSATFDTNAQKVVGAGAVNSDFLAFRLNNDGTLDSTFGSGGTIKIDFGTTSANTTDGGRSVVMRSIDGVVDILVAGYTYDSATAKYKIALADLLDKNTIEVV
jgi:hypothetical protein